MHAPAPHHAQRSNDPGPFTLLLLFVGSLFAAGAIGLFLWESNPAANEGRAFGTETKMAPGGVSAAPAGGGGAAAAGLDPHLVEKGQGLVRQLGCLACHTTDGKASAGPTWKGLAGSQVPLDDGHTVAGDDAYIKESILEPDAKVHKGFAKGVMAGSISGAMAQLKSGDNTDAIVAYIKSLK